MNNKLKTQADEFQNLFLALIDDAERCRKILEVWPVPFSCRIYLRTVFPLFEGSAHGMKQMAMAIDEFNQSLGNQNLFTDEELKDLMNDNLAIAENMKCALRCYAQAMGKNLDIDFSKSKEWQLYHECVKLRKQLVHPKTKESLEFTTKQLDAFIKTVNWFQGVVINIAT